MVASEREPYAPHAEQSSAIIIPGPTGMSRPATSMRVGYIGKPDQIPGLCYLLDYPDQEGTNVHFSNVHFVLCQNFGLNLPFFHVFFPPAASLLLPH